MNPSLVVTAVGQKTVKPTNEKIGAKNGQDQAVKKSFSFDLKLSNGHSPANLSNSSTRQNGHFGKLAGLYTFPDIRQPVLVGLDTFVEIRQTILLGLARLAKGKFGNFYGNLANLANLASVD